MYYPDLTAYTYSKMGVPALNVGWLDCEHAFQTGDVPKGFLQQIKRFWPNVMHSSLGSHVCDLCNFGPIQGDPSNEDDFISMFCTFMERASKAGATGCGVIVVATRLGAVYVAPTLIIHYIPVHKYRPPQEFIDAVMDPYSVAPLATYPACFADCELEQRINEGT